MKRFAAGIAVVLALSTASALAASPWTGSYAWFSGDDQAGIGRMGTALSAFSNQDFNVHAHHLRFESEDGNVEMESGDHAAATMLTPYYIGTSRRKPLQVGGAGDGEDVLSLIVAGTPGQKNNLQEWRSGTATVAAITSTGQLRLGGVAVSVQMRNGRAVLVATLPNGKKQTLAFR
jgi:hypothetical protein